MVKPIFSFITPTCNYGQYICRCYWSLCQQTVPDWEWVVVDDGSTDGTRDIIRLLDDPRIQYHRFLVTRGRGAARSHGLNVARGEWLAIMDMDDISCPTRLERALESRHAGYDFHCSRMLLVNNQTEIIGVRGWQTNVYPKTFPHATLCGRADLVRSIGYPSAYNGGEDQTMVLRLANSYNGFFDPKPLYVYYESANINIDRAVRARHNTARQVLTLMRNKQLASCRGTWKYFFENCAKVVGLWPLQLLPGVYRVLIAARSRMSSEQTRAAESEYREFLQAVREKFNE